LTHVGTNATASVATDTAIAAVTGMSRGHATAAMSSARPAEPRTAAALSGTPVSRSPCRHPDASTLAHVSEAAAPRIAAGHCRATAEPAEPVAIAPAQMAQDTSRGLAWPERTSRR